MALGGGTFLTQNKKLPGSYINFVSAARASAEISDRGYAAMGLELDWGADGEIFTVEASDLEKESKRIFGYAYTSQKLKALRDLFLNAKVLYAYRLNSGLNAENDFARAKHSGIRGNDIKIVIRANVDDSGKFDVTTLLDDISMDVQTVSAAEELMENDYVTFKDMELAETAGAPLVGGTNGEVTGEAHQTFLDRLESFSFNTLGCASSEEAVKSLYTAYTKRMRDETGVKFQTVIYRKAADYEGVINLKNAAIGSGEEEASLVYWLTGAAAGCAVNKSNTNKKYEGEFTPDTGYKQSELEKCIENGEFVLHKVGDEVRALEDINSFVSSAADKSGDFSLNQVVRTLDQIGNDIAALFNTKYLGKVQNNEAGRVALWNDIVTYNREMELLQAIEGYVADETRVEAGADKKSVVVTNPVTPVAAMSKLYMTVIVA